MDELKLIYVGRLERRKGILDLIEAVRILEAEGRRLRLVICSSRGKLTGMIERICQKFDFIDFRGYVNREELIEEYSNADLAVFPSEREPFGMVFLEAMSCGLPVIGVKRGGPQLIVDDMVNGILIQRRGAKEIAEAIEYFVDNPKEIVRMGNNAREKMAKEYSKEKVAGRFLRAVHHKATDGHRVRLKCNF